MVDILGIITLYPAVAVVSLIIAVIGAMIFAPNSNMLRAIIGAVVFAVGLIGLAESFRIEGLGWLNNVLQIAAVIYVGFTMTKSASKITTAIGVVVVVLAICSLFLVRPLNLVKVDDSFGQRFEKNFSDLIDILTPEGDVIPKKGPAPNKN